MKVFCSALASGKYVPTRCVGKSVSGGQNVSIPVSWTDIPTGVKSFAVSMVDHHPSTKGIVHWIVINISANARNINEGASLTRKLPPDSVELRNGFGTIGYSGPQLPKRSGPHEYVITVYALRVKELPLGPISPFTQFQTELSGKVIDSASLVAVSG